MKKEHPHAQVLRWIADGEVVQFRIPGEEVWFWVTRLTPIAVAELFDGQSTKEFRIRPKTITVGDREIEAPVMSGPGYYLTNYGDVFRWFEDANLNPPIDLQKLGRVFATEEAARAAQEAITALLTKEPS